MFEFLQKYFANSLRVEAKLEFELLSFDVIRHKNVQLHELFRTFHVKTSACT